IRPRTAFEPEHKSNAINPLTRCLRPRQAVQTSPCNSIGERAGDFFAGRYLLRTIVERQCTQSADCAAPYGHRLRIEGNLDFFRNAFLEMRFEIAFRQASRQQYSSGRGTSCDFGGGEISLFRKTIRGIQGYTTAIGEQEFAALS